jgi:hypothetical protein
MRCGVTNTMGAAKLLRKFLAEADPDLIRTMVQSSCRSGAMVGGGYLGSGSDLSFDDQRVYERSKTPGQVDEGRVLMIRSGPTIT